MPGAVYHDACFKCKFWRWCWWGGGFCPTPPNNSFSRAGEVCSVKLTLKTLNSREGKVFCPTHKPYDAPNQVIDSTTASAMAAPDSTMTKREFAKSDANHSYGAGAVVVQTATSAPKPPTTVNNINRMEVLHQGVGKFASS